MMELDFTNEVTINELVQICKIVKSKKAKQDFLEKIANKLTKENYTSLNQTLKEDIKDLFRETYNNDVFVLLERVFQQPSAQNIVIQVIPDNQNQPNIISKNQGEVENVKHNTSQRLDFSDLSFNNATCSSSAVNFAIQQDDDVSGDVNLNTNNELIRTEELVPDTQLVQKTTSASETGNSEHNTMSSIEDDDVNCDVNLNTNNELIRTDDLVKDTQLVQKRMSTSDTADSEYNSISIIESESEVEEVQGNETIENVGENSPENSEFQNFSLISNKVIFNTTFKVQTAVMAFKFKNIPTDITKLPNFLDNVFCGILSFITRKALSHHKIGLKIVLPNLNPVKSIHFTEVSQLDPNAIASVLKVSGSNYLITETLEIISTILQIPCGKGRTARPVSSKQLIKHKVKSVIDLEIESSPIYCLPVAILLAICLVENHKNKIRLYKRNVASLMKDVDDLNRKANITISRDCGAALTDLPSYQNALPQYNIIVFNDKTNFRKLVFCGDNSAGKRLNIFYFEDISHFVALRNVRTFFDMRYQCANCFELYNVRNKHKCSNKCKSCEAPFPCKTKNPKIRCDLCNRSFYGPICFANHKASVCTVLRFCIVCAKLVDRRQEGYKIHSCNESTCPVCLKVVNTTHRCYIQKYKEKRPDVFSIIFYKLECTQNRKNERAAVLDEPNLCVAHIVCNECIMIPQMNYKCPKCVTTKRKHIFETSYKEKCIKQFIDFCETVRRNFAIVFCVAHNFKVYEGHFILKELLSRNLSLNPIMGGMTIYKITYDDQIIFIDSLNFLPMPLSEFPDAFSLENVAIGWYPHLFNTRENYTYIGKFPERKYFNLALMSVKECDQFNKWYEHCSKLKGRYNNRENLIKYCNRDVDVLRRGCVSFMGSFTAITALNPLVQTISLSQAVMDAYRKQFLLENTLSIVPTNLYRISKNKKPSQLALKWLAYENNSRTDRGNIEYDVKIPDTQLYVDGFCEGQKTIYEFLECYLNGCKECFLNRGQNLIDGNQDKFDTRLDQVNLKIEYLESLGYRVAKIWECHFKKFLKLNPHVANSLKNDPEVLNKHLNPKDAIYGGRTETFQMYYKVKPDEKICYYEFNSLYPYIMKTGKSPLDHPKIHDKGDCKSLDISNMDGLIKCSILPPQDLLIPVLPIKINNEIVFALCRTCAEENISSPCRHNDSERMLIGTWVLDEVKLATKNSYKIHEIFEIWEYKVAQYKVNGGLFTEYMNFLLKLQQEANDWPPNVNLEIEKVQYIQEFFSHEGIQLDALQIKNNPFLKQFCKLALDAFASKFIEGNNTSQTAIIYTTLELYAFASSPGILITDLVAIDDVLWVSWQYSKDVGQLENVSLPVGAFTTANARIKLYSELDKISNQVLYCDTDAIIFVENVNNKGELETGNFIGDLTNKLSEYGKNAFITEFASTGPNCFTYIVFDPDKNAYFEIAMCNGVKLQVNSKNILDLCSLISMGQNNDEEFRVVHDKERNKKRKVVKNVSESNMFGTK